MADGIRVSEEVWIHSSCVPKYVTNILKWWRVKCELSQAVNCGGRRSSFVVKDKSGCLVMKLN
jgi:hypothetical protein